MGLLIIHWNNVKQNCYLKLLQHSDTHLQLLCIFLGDGHFKMSAENLVIGKGWLTRVIFISFTLIMGYLKLVDPLPYVEVDN